MKANNKLEYGYIYLIKIDNTNHYKIGKTKSFIKRFSNYKNIIPTVILQILVKDYHLVGKKILEQFKNKFKNIKERGNGYFSGDELELRNIILKYVLNSSSSQFTILKDSIELEKVYDGEYIEDKKITTWEEYKSTSRIKDIIITNKKTLTGFIKYEDRYHRNIHEECDKRLTNNFENLKSWINSNTSFYPEEIDYNKLIQDISNKCYTNIKPYKLKYNETVITKRCEKYIDKILNFETFIEKDILSIPPLKMIIFPPFSMVSFNNNNVSFANGLLESYIINKNILHDYKEIFKSVFLKKNNKSIIIYDTNYTNSVYKLMCILERCIYTFLGEGLRQLTKKFKSYKVYYEHYNERLFIIYEKPDITMLIKKEEIELKKIIEYLEMKKPCNIIIPNSSNNFYDSKSLTKYFYQNKESYKEYYETELSKKILSSKMPILDYNSITDIFERGCLTYEILYIMLN
jgi:hypothetical protein